MSEKNTSLADQAYETIKRNILNLTYPPGMVLTEALLTRELGMSRSPVRTAIQMLQAEGLIVSDYYKSTNQDYIVHCAIREGKAQLLEINISVPDKEQAEHMCGRWNKESQKLYSVIMQSLMKE